MPIGVAKFNQALGAKGIYQQFQRVLIGSASFRPFLGSRYPLSPLGNPGIKVIADDDDQLLATELSLCWKIERVGLRKFSTLR